MTLMKLTRARRLTNAQRDLIDSDRELVSILIGWARKRGGESYPAEELVHDSLIVAAASWDPTRSKWRTWATGQVRWAFGRYAKALHRDRTNEAGLLAAAESVGARAHKGREVVATRGRGRRSAS